MATYLSGIGASITFTPTGGSTFNVDNFNWNQEETNRLAETTNGLTGAVSAWISGVADITGTFDAVFDATQTPESKSLVRGLGGVLVQKIGNTGHQETVTIIIEKVTKKIDVRQGAIVYSVAWKANGVTNAAI